MQNSRTGHGTWSANCSRTREAGETGYCRDVAEAQVEEFQTERTTFWVNAEACIVDLLMAIRERYEELANTHHEPGVMDAKVGAIMVYSTAREALLQEGALEHFRAIEEERQSGKQGKLAFT